MILLPVVRDEATAAFFDGTARGALLLRRSVRTGEVLAPPAEQDSDGNTELEWVEASGLGSVVSWAFVPGKTAGTPRKSSDMVIGLVELDEGPWWWTQLVDVEKHEVHDGLRVRAEFHRSGLSVEHELVPVFGPCR